MSTAAENPSPQAETNQEHPNKGGSPVSPDSVREPRNTQTKEEPMPTVSQSQHAVLEVAIELVRVDHRLFEITTSLPVPPDLADMENDEVPHDSASYLHGVINCVRQDMLQGAIGVLKGAAQKSDSELRADFKTLYGALEAALAQKKSRGTVDTAAKKR